MEHDCKVARSSSMTQEEKLVPDYSEEIDDNPLALRRPKEYTHPQSQTLQTIMHVPDQ